MSSCLRALQRSWDEEETEFQKQIPSLSMSLDCCLLGNVVAGFIGGTEARDWFTCDNNGTVGTPKRKHIKIILSQFFSQKINRPNTGGHCPVLHHDQDPPLPVSFAVSPFTVTHHWTALTDTLVTA